jgi:hypothetical protein
MAQNNAIFFGGSGDGWSMNSYLQASNTTINHGSGGDGWNKNSYLQASNTVSNKGGMGDGWNKNSYLQTSNLTLYHGDTSDGWSMKSFLQNSIPPVYYGGQGDGWITTNFFPNVTLKPYHGGQGDGWASNYTPLGPLPVTLLTFKVEKVNETALLNWETSTEINSSHFEIEKSNNAIDFSFLGTVKSENNISGANYSFVDEHPLVGYNYYRIKMVDIDGKFEYTPTRHVIFDGYDSFDGLKIFPNPSNGLVYIDIPMFRNLEPMAINITNSFGQVLKQDKTNTEPKRLQYDLSSYAKGVYYIQVKSKSYQKIEKIILQ